MDIEDIDMWYDDEKIKITEQYQKKMYALLKDYEPEKYDSLADMKSPKAQKEATERYAIYQEKKVKLKEHFDKQLDNLSKKYDKKIARQLGKDVRKHFIKERFNRFKNRILEPYYDRKKRKENEKD